MENMDSNGGGRLVVTQLSHIKELVKQLDEHLGGCPDLCRRLASQISAVTEWCIGSMVVSSSGSLKRSAGGAGFDSPPPLSATPSSLSGVSDVPFKANKKRKMMEKRMVRVSSAGGRVETVVDDGHSWRKYGQKDILGTKHPRAYYRCTHRHTQGCTATKHVQRDNEDPTVFEVIYQGTHTCVDKAAAATATAAAAVSKAQPEQNPTAQSLLQSLSASLTVKTEGLTAEPRQGLNAATPFCFTSPVTGLAPPEHYPFSTPSTPENCFGQGVSSLSPSLEPSPATSESMAPFHAEGRAQAEFQEFVSALALASTASTPVPAVVTDFSVDALEFYPDFTIDVSSFFP